MRASTLLGFRGSFDSHGPYGRPGIAMDIAPGPKQFTVVWDTEDAINVDHFPTMIPALRFVYTLADTK